MTPRATYRLQFGPGMGFAQAAALAPYLAKLGVSHLYASPWLQARAGTSHGYDIVDHNAISTELGGDAGFARLHAALQAHALGHILDFVPNHMGVARADNAWWLDVLEWGRASPFATYFDIDWSSPDPALRNKVLLPFLGDDYGSVLERGELEPRFDPAAGTFSVWYFDHRFPLAPHTCASVLRAAAAHGDDADGTLASLASAFDPLHVVPGSSPRDITRVRAAAGVLKARLAADASLHPRLKAAAAMLAVTAPRWANWRPLHTLLERQAYRLAGWRVAAEEINYRRFVDINDLAALRVENGEVFKRIHALVTRLLETGKLDGLRIDHIDGLSDPSAYLHRLRQHIRRPFYLVVEKVLARDEHLRDDWPIDGTTGYDFLNQVNALLIDARAQAVLTRAYARFTGCDRDFDDIAHASRERVVHTTFLGTLFTLARQLHAIAQCQPRTREYTVRRLARALAAVLAAFPVYRTYVDERGANGDDRRVIVRAVAQARRRWSGHGADILDFVALALGVDPVLAATCGRRRVLQFAMRFQQYSGAVMAKGFEDTALYRYHRLDGLNEVGGDPRHLGMSVARFHGANRERAERWPHAMLATATHDTKRGEDVRARLAALSSMAAEWSQAVRHWGQLNDARKRSVRGEPAPDRNDEYLLYQTLLGAWPVELMEGAWDCDVAGRFVARVQAYMVKALREAKRHGTWADPDDAYENATTDFVARILARDDDNRFLDAFLPLQHHVAERGVHNSLVQLALKLTCPGVPDIYQGCELWDLALVDPDNRRTVDFQQRAACLIRTQAWDAMAPTQRAAQLDAWRAQWHDGAIKLHVLRRLLALRATHPQLFSRGAYESLPIPDAPPDGALAFARVLSGERVIVIANVRRCPMEPLVNCLQRAMACAHGTRLVEILSGTHHDTREPATLGTPFARLPVAVWLEDTGSQ